MASKVCPIRMHAIESRGGSVDFALDNDTPICIENRCMAWDRGRCKLMTAPWLEEIKHAIDRASKR